MLLANVDYHRVAFELGRDRKRAFAKKCAVEGRSMTDICQELIDAYLARKPRVRACHKSKLYVPRAGAGLEENERF